MKELTKALIKVQQTIKPVVKDAENPFFKSHYATLGAVYDGCREALADNGFAVTQSTGFAEGHFVLITTLLHESGQVVSGSYLIKPEKDTPQGYGSAITYARRYALAALVGIVTEDDDAEGSMNRTPSKPIAKAKAQLHDADTLEFIPAAYKAAVGKKPHSVMTPDKEWFGTYNIALGAKLEKAFKEKMAIVVYLETKGQYKNIVDVIFPDTAEIEEVPF